MFFYCGSSHGNSYSRFIQLSNIFPNPVLFDPSLILDSYPYPLNQLEWRLQDGLCVRFINRIIIRYINHMKPNIIWFDKGVLVFPSTIRKIKKMCPNAIVVASYPDNYHRNIYTRHIVTSIPIVDVLFLPQDHTINTALASGAKAVYKYWKGYSENCLYIKDQDSVINNSKLCDVSFIGHFEPNRYQDLLAVNQNGYSIALGGPGWQNKSWPNPKAIVNLGVVPFFEMKYAIRRGKLSINYLSYFNEDSQNSRAFEIPATHTAMLCQRSEDLEMCYREGIEADFFTTTEELLTKVQYYLHNEEMRKNLASNGYRRVIESGYSNSARSIEMARLVQTHTGRPSVGDHQ